MFLDPQLFLVSTLECVYGQHGVAAFLELANFGLWCSRARASCGKEGTEENESRTGRWKKRMTDPRLKMSLSTSKTLNKLGFLYSFAKPSYSILNVTAKV